MKFILNAESTTLVQYFTNDYNVQINRTGIPESNCRSHDDVSTTLQTIVHPKI